jgi:hypothetical protein
MNPEPAADQPAPVVCHYTALLRWGLPLGVLFFVGVAGLFLCWLCLGYAPFPTWGFCILIIAFFVYWAAVGARLLPFRCARIVADSVGLRITTPSADRFHPWAEVANTIDHPNQQILDVFASDGSRILSVDYFLNNFLQLRERIGSYTSQSHFTRKETAAPTG